MKRYLKYSAFLLIVFLLINCAGIILRDKLELKFSSEDLFMLSFVFAAISAVTLIIFFTGRNKEVTEQGMHTLVAIGTKFLAELVLVLIWFVLAKKASSTYVILFFVLYLSFSMFSIGLILKTLKKKPL
jgi:hypothetical protein